MKVVLFCGGMGMRMREYSESVPKPMVPVGRRPILWHLMQYYASYGHTDFVLCTGWRGEVIREYFRSMERVDGRRTRLAREHPDWRVEFVDSGVNASVGERLRAARTHLEGEDRFLANYADGLSDVPMDDVIRFAEEGRFTAAFVAVRPSQSFHVVSAAQDGRVTSIHPVSAGDQRINGGFFVLRRAIFDVLGEGEDLVEAPFARLIDTGGLGAYRYDGFWACMDTYKEKQRLDEIHASGRIPWMREGPHRVAHDRPAIRSRTRRLPEAGVPS